MPELIDAIVENGMDSVISTLGKVGGRGLTGVIQGEPVRGFRNNTIVIQIKLAYENWVVALLEGNR